MTDKKLIQALRDEGITDVGDMMDYMEDAADRLESLLAENERLKAQLPKWRPAGNPPKESVTIFARDMAGVVTTAYYNGSWHGMLNCDAVTHWMPLPSTEGWSE